MRQITVVFLLILFMFTTQSSSFLSPILRDSFLIQRHNYVAGMDDPELSMPSIRGPPDIEYVENESGNTLTWKVENGSSEKYEVWRSAHDDLNLNRVQIQQGYLLDGNMSITISVDGLTAGVYDFSLYVWCNFCTCIWLDVVTVTVVPVAPIDNTMLIALIGISCSIVTIIVLMTLKFLRYKK